MLMIGKQLSAEQRVKKATVDIMGNPRYTALAGVLMIGNKSVDDKTPTAYTNGRDEVYGRAFVDSLSDAELRYLELHECYHKLYRHLTTWKELYDINASVANQACDYAINIRISDDNTDGFAVMPIDKATGKPKGLLDAKYRGMSAGEIFNLLQKAGEGEGEGEGEGDDGTGIGKSGKGKPAKDGGESDGGLDSHDWDGAKDMDSEEQKQLERDIDEAVRQGALLAGKTGSGGNRDLEELLKTKVNWREELREFITTTCAGCDYASWRKLNRRFLSINVCMPSGVSEQVDELVIGVDTSGSIGGRELSQFLGEVQGIVDMVKPNAIRLLYWDTRVCKDEKFVGDEVQNLTKTTKPAGGGGTDVRCVPVYMAEHGIKAQAVIILTDGYLGNAWGDWTMPVLWCIVGNKSAVPSVGKCVHVEWD